MKIKVFLEEKKGSSKFMDDYLDLLASLVEKYPNALWRKFKSKKGYMGYELKV